MTCNTFCSYNLCIFALRHRCSLCDILHWQVFMHHTAVEFVVEFDDRCKTERR